MGAIAEQVAHRHGVEDVGVKANVAKMEVGGKGDQTIVTSIINTAGVDLDNEVVVPMGADLTYFLGKDADQDDGTRAVFWQHDYHLLPVAKCRTLKTHDDRIVAQAAMSRHPFARDVTTAIEDGAVRGTSVGFRWIDRSPPTSEEVAKYGPDCVSVVRKWLMLEYSFTGNPANGEALNQLVTAGKVARKSAAFMRPDLFEAERKSWPTTGEAGETKPKRGRRVFVHFDG